MSMSGRNTGLTSGQLQRHWKGYALEGFLMLVVGILALAAPLAATLASTLFFGWLLVIGGALGGAAAFQSWGHSGFWSGLALAVLAVILGAIILANPFAGAITLTWTMAVVFLLSGFVQFGMARQIGQGGSGRFALILGGIVNLALAALLILGLPGTAVWAVGVYIGVSLVFSGTSLLFAALTVKSTTAGA